MGRLFDAVSSLAGVRQVVAYEAQAAIELEGMSRDCDAGAAAYSFHIDDDAVPRDHRPCPGDRGGRRRRPRRPTAGRDRSHVPSRGRGCGGRPCRFEWLRARTIALSGGVFQNALLLRLVLRALRDKVFEVITHRLVPPNDGGIALGQLLVGNSV